MITISLICLLVALIGSLALPFIRQCREDAALEELKQKGILK